VMNGLREVHTNKLLHLDLKPANIYLRVDGTPILLDFGAARQTLRADSPKLYPMYTPGFAPPELYLKNGNLGPWTDIYSIGASIFACMVGAPPQPADQRKVNDRMDSHYRKLEGVYSPELVQLVRWSLMIDPLQRPQSVFAMQKALKTQLPQKKESAVLGAVSKLRGLFAPKATAKAGGDSGDLTTGPVPSTTIQENTN
jgi:serine/threonine protein kinase